MIKYRGSSVAETEDFPLLPSGRHGLVVATLGATAPELTYPISTERIATGVERLDTMFGRRVFSRLHRADQRGTGDG